MIENLRQKLFFYVDASDENQESILSPFVHIATTRKKMQLHEINSDSAKPVSICRYSNVF